MNALTRILFAAGIAVLIPAQVQAGDPTVAATVTAIEKESGNVTLIPDRTKVPVVYKGWHKAAFQFQGGSQAGFKDLAVGQRITIQHALQGTQPVVIKVLLPDPIAAVQPVPTVRKGPANDGDITTEPGSNARTDRDITTEPGSKARTDNDITTQPGTKARTDNDITTQPGSKARTDNDITTQPGSKARIDNDITTQPGSKAATDNDITTQPGN